MNHSSQAGLIVEGVTPPAADPPDAAPTCIDCGRCRFSAASYLEVIRHTVYLEADCTFRDTRVKEKWPYDAHSSDRWVWRKDANNYATYICAENRWDTVVDARHLDISGGVGCDVTEGQPFVHASCEWANFYEVYNRVPYLVMQMTLFLNDCSQAP